MSSVFISYSSQDYETAFKIRTSLLNHGVRVTIDRHDLTGNIDEFIQRDLSAGGDARAGHGLDRERLGVVPWH